MDISESIEAILNSPDLIGGQFYRRFFQECPHLEMFFEGIDMEHQAAKLTSAIVLIETYYSREAQGLSPYLRLLGAEHERRGISIDDFADWTESMLRTLEEFHGDDWSKPLERQWYAAIRNASKEMLSAYSDPEPEF